MTRVSVWDDYTGVVTLPPGTPDIRIRAEKDPHQIQVYADDKLVHSTDQYPAAHRWVMNEFRLTSTMMLPVYEDFVSHKASAATTAEQST